MGGYDTDTVRSVARGLALPLVLLLSVACADGGTDPDTLRFGQVGEVQIEVTTPIGARDRGTVRQVLVWASDGPWELTETISYRGLRGDVDVRPSQGNPGTFASAYASLITLVNESSGVKLFTEEVAQDLDPECGPARTRVDFRIRDESRGATADWTRCTTGTLESLSPEAARPDAGAVRVIQAALLARDFSLGEDFRSVYHGSVPFGTLDRGSDSGANLPGPRAFVGRQGRAPGDWLPFWIQHTGGDDTPPEVDWSEEMVIAGAVGVREEAGDSVEVRKILSVDRGSLVEIWERVPGNFCSPADLTHVPFHIVVAPRTPNPIRFGDIRVEQVPCGI